MPLTLLRHSAPPAIYHKRYLGWSDIEIDTNLFNFDKVKDITSQNFDVVYSSDLKRCTKTLELLGFDFIKDTRLREVKFKDKIELKSFDEVEKLECFKASHLINEHTWFDYIASETYDEYTSRISSFLYELPKDKNILICSHKGTLNMILQLLNIQKTEFDYLQNNYIDCSSYNIFSNSCCFSGTL